MDNTDIQMATDIVTKLSDILTPMSQTVWEAYLKQSLLSGYCDLLIGLLFAFLLTSVMGLLIRAYAKKGIENITEDDMGFSIFCTCLYFVFMVIVILYIRTGILHVMNPEYYAIENILSSLVGGI